MKTQKERVLSIDAKQFIKEWVSQGKGVSVVVKRAVSGEELKTLSVIPLKESLSMEISVCFLKSRKNDRTIQKFSDHLKELSQKPPFKNP